MYELKKNGKVQTSKSVGTGPSSYEKRIYRAAVSQRLRNTVLSLGGNHLYAKFGNHCIYLSDFYCDTFIKTKSSL